MKTQKTLGGFMTCAICQLSADGVGTGLSAPWPCSLLLSCKGVTGKFSLP